jgi:hypothetical protein
MFRADVVNTLSAFVDGNGVIFNSQKNEVT